MQTTHSSENDAEQEFVPEKITFFTPWKKITTRQGRSCRKEFWYLFLPWLFLPMLHWASWQIAEIPSVGSLCFVLFMNLFNIFIFFAICNLCVRRLHDVGFSGVWLGLYWLGSLLIPVIVMSYMGYRHGACSDCEGAWSFIYSLLALGAYSLPALFLIPLPFMISLGCIDSQGGSNKYGNNPKGDNDCKRNLLQKLQMRSVLLKYIVVFALFLLSFLPVTVLAVIQAISVISVNSFSLSEEEIPEFIKYSPEGKMMLFMRALSEDNPENTVKMLRDLADVGYVPAQFHLGFCYAEGKGVAKDDSEAVKWIRKAAEQGHAEAQYVLGVCYAVGKVVAKDDSEAVKWYRKAAEQGLAEAQYHLGACYAEGIGVEKDKNEAEKWFRKAAEQGFERR